MSAVHALNGYRKAQTNIRAALANWFYDPFCWEFCVTLRDGGNAAELNRLFEEWGR